MVDEKNNERETEEKTKQHGLFTTHASSYILLSTSSDSYRGSVTVLLASFHSATEVDGLIVGT